MTPIESKLKELENLNRYPTKHGDSVISKDIQQLIQALREAVARLEFYAASWGKEHGYSEPTNDAIQRVLNQKRATAIAGLKCIEKILNGGK